jgi:hypothetical protein
MQTIYTPFYARLYVNVILKGTCILYYVTGRTRGLTVTYKFSIQEVPCSILTSVNKAENKKCLSV